jgi:RIO kinase 2
LSQVRRAAQATELLQGEDYLLLREFVRSLKNFDRVPLDVMAALSFQPRERAEFHLSKLEKVGLVNGDRQGYRLLGQGLDALALHSYSEAGLLTRLGPSIAMGKESDVFEALDGDERTFALKFFRLGRISFRDIKRKRGYSSPEEHAWLAANIQAAAREAKILKGLEGSGLPVPKVKTFMYHTVMMEMEMGIPLYKVKELDDAKSVLSSTLLAIHGCYDVGMVHGDLSEFNILLTAEHRIVLIDWPQAIKKTHPNAKEQLRRDVTNVVRFFNRRYGLGYDTEDALSEILDGKLRS